jgi:PsbP-like protein
MGVFFSFPISHFATLFVLSVFFSLLLIITISYSSQQVIAISSKTTTSNFLSYKNSTLGITMQYPVGWTVKYNHQELDFQELDKLNFYSPKNISGLVISVQQQHLPLEVLITDEINSLRESYKNFQLIESRPTTLKDNLAHILVYTYNHPKFGLLKTMEIMLINLDRIEIDKVYSIYYYANLEKYSDYLPFIQKIINSFEIADKSINSFEKPLDCPSNITQNFVTYYNPTYGIRMQYPSNACSSTIEEYASDRIIRGFPLDIITEIYLPPAEWIYLEVRNLTSNKLLDEFTPAQISSYKLGFTDFKLIGSNATLLGGNPADKIEYTYRCGDNECKRIEVWTIKDDKVYSIVHLMIGAGRHSYYLPIIQKMIDSFQITSSHSSIRP